MELAAKIGLVLGGSRGIGKAIGFALARAGATVILTYYDWPEDSRAMQEELAALGGNHSAIRVDLRDPLQIGELFRHIRDSYGRLDILINNIERGGMPVVHGPYTREQWDVEIDTTLTAKWRVFQSALPLLQAAEEAAVVVVSSIAGLVGRSGPAAQIFNDGYAAANRAVTSFTEIWARMGAPRVRVNELMLGFFETRHAEKTRGWNLLSDEQRRAIRQHILLNRTGRVEEAVRAVLFLIRDATYMTGSVLRLDGGYVLGGAVVPDLPPGVDDLAVKL